MTSRKDMLVQMAGEHMAESMGARSATAPGPVTVPPGGAGAAPGRYEGVKAYRDAKLIPIDKLVPDPDQPRKTFSDEAIDRLADSLRSRGMLQPIRARWDADLARWIIVAGERRFRTARRAGWTEVPCITVEAAMTASEIRLDQIIENALREDVPPLEQAAAFKALIDENDWSARRLAEELNLSPQTVLRALDLLVLPEAVRQKVASGEIAPRTAAEIATLDTPEEQIALAAQVAAEKLSRDQVTEVVKAKKSGLAVTSKRPRMEIEGEGVKLTLTGPAVAAGDRAAIRVVLARALEQLDTEDRDQARDEAA